MSPRTTVIVPSVATNGLTPRYAISQPLVTPTSRQASEGADDPDGNAGRPEIDHQRCADDARQRRHGADRQIEAAEDDREGHAAGDDADDRILLQDVDDVLVGPEGRLRCEHEGDEQHERR